MRKRRPPQVGNRAGWRPTARSRVASPAPALPTGAAAHVYASNAKGSKHQTEPARSQCSWTEVRWPSAPALGSPLGRSTRSLEQDPRTPAATSAQISGRESTAGDHAARETSPTSSPAAEIRRAQPGLLHLGCQRKTLVQRVRPGVVRRFRRTSAANIRKPSSPKQGRSGNRSGPGGTTHF